VFAVAVAAGPVAAEDFRFFGPETLKLYGIQRIRHNPSTMSDRLCGDKRGTEKFFLDTFNFNALQKFQLLQVTHGDGQHAD
jgi:hypothetical protein